MTDERISDQGSPKPVLRVKGRELVVDRVMVMGVVNASPESFSDAGRFSSLDQQLGLCSSLVESGADIIDVGGQSAITNRPELNPAEEVERVLPIVEWLSAHHPEVIVSVDTYKPQVVDAVLRAGAAIINDVSGVMNAGIVDACISHRAALVVMHTRAGPKVRLQRADLYDDVVVDVVDFLAERTRFAVERGLPLNSVIVDPGPDFTKTPFQTVTLLRGIEKVRALGRPVLLALSRKDFLGAITGRSPRARDAATHAAIAHFGATPGYIVRVHDVAAARDVISTVEVLAGRRDLDPACLLPDDIRHERAG